MSFVISWSDNFGFVFTALNLKPLSFNLLVCCCFIERTFLSFSSEAAEEKDAK